MINLLKQEVECKGLAASRYEMEQGTRAKRYSNSSIDAFELCRRSTSKSGIRRWNLRLPTPKQGMPREAQRQFDWKLIADLRVSSRAEAVEKVEWYALRNWRQRAQESQI